MNSRIVSTPETNSSSVDTPFGPPSPIGRSIVTTDVTGRPSGQGGSDEMDGVDEGKFDL